MSAPTSMVPARRRQPTIPRGTYDATVRSVEIVRRREGKGWGMRIVAQATRLGSNLVSWQPLALGDVDDPWQLTPSQEKRLRKYATDLGAPDGTMPWDIPAFLGTLAEGGVVIQATVKQSAVGQQVTFTAASVERVNGEVIDAAGDAHEAHTQLLDGLRGARLGLAMAAQGCHRLKLSEGWRDLGYETLTEYLASPEVTLKRSEFYRLADIWRRYVIDGGLDATLLAQAGPSKLEVPLPALEQGVVDAEQALADAAAMPRKDLREHYAELMGEDPQEAGPASSGVDASCRRESLELLPDMLDRATQASQRWFRERQGQLPADESEWREHYAFVLGAALEIPA